MWLVPARGLRAFGCNQDKRHNAGLLASIVPVVQRAALDDDVAGLQMHFAVFHFHPHLARKADCVVDGVGLVPARDVVGFVAPEAEHGAAREARSQVPGVRILFGCLGGQLARRPHWNVVEARAQVDRHDIAVPLDAAFSVLVKTGDDSAAFDAHR